jgi:hypothetical protein
MPFTLDQINQALGTITVTEAERRYLLSYRELLAHFAGFDPLTLHTFIVGSHLVYAWMPTMLTLYPTNDDYANIIAVLNDVRHSQDISLENLILLKSIVNHSLVGSSKLLHCLNPDHYAIWDSRVYRFIHNTQNQHQLNQPINYLAYLQNCREIVAQNGFPNIHAQINQMIGYPVSGYRAIEWVMYMNGGN